MLGTGEDEEFQVAVWEPFTILWSRPRDLLGLGIGFPSGLVVVPGKVRRRSLWLSVQQGFWLDS
jgi:hypothetical protein